MECECGKNMIKRHEDYVLASRPPQHPWYWWCGCGKRKEGGIEVGKTYEEIAMEQWEKTNREDGLCEVCGAKIEREGYYNGMDRS